MRPALDSLPERPPVTAEDLGAAAEPHRAVVRLGGRPHLHIGAISHRGITETPDGYVYLDDDDRPLFCLHTCGRLATILDDEIAAAAGVAPGEAIPRLLASAPTGDAAAASEFTMCVVPAAVTEVVPPLAVLVAVALTERQNTLHPSTSPATVRHVWGMLDQEWDVGSIRRSLRELLEAGYVKVEKRRWRLAYQAAEDVSKGRDGESQGAWGDWGGVSFQKALDHCKLGRRGLTALRVLIATAATLKGKAAQIQRSDVVKICGRSRATISRAWRLLQGCGLLKTERPEPHLADQGLIVEVPATARGRPLLC